MLKILDDDGRVVFTLDDCDEEPQPVNKEPTVVEDKTKPEDEKESVDGNK